MLGLVSRFIIIIILIIQFVLVLVYAFTFVKKNVFTQEKDLSALYGRNAWVLVTGCSSGQGKLIAIEFAKRNFNIILMGNKGIKDTEKIINTTAPHVKTICVVTNFCKAYKTNYFKKLEKILNTLPEGGELAVLVNNIGHRTAWNPYHEMPVEKIKDTIVCGTIVQARLTQIAIQHFVKRQQKSCIINITAMCIYSNFWFGLTGEISVPYLSVYEAANAFGFYHSNSIQKEYENIIDVLNITPGAVLTENTRDMLNNVKFCVDEKVFVKNIFKLIGNYTGAQYAYWGHEISSIMSNVYLNPELLKVGRIIAETYMNLYR